jgi:tetratricopeptide (TPR) repeat protein
MDQDPAMKGMLLPLIGILGLAWVCPVCSGAIAQDTGEPIRLVLGKPQVVGVMPAIKGLDINTLDIVVKFALSAYPELEVTTAATFVPTTDKPRVMSLTSIVQGNNEIALWNGDLTRTDGKTVRLGPIVLGDATGLRTDAPRLIANLVTRTVRDEYAPRGSLAIRLGCFRGDDDRANAVATDFREALGLAFRQARIPVRNQVTDGRCELDFTGRNQDETLVTATAKGESSYTVIPSLTDATYQQVPLPSFRGEEATYVQQRREYAALIVRAVRSYRDCPTMTLIDASQVLSRSTEQRIAVARDVLKQQTCFYLVVALLESTESTSADVILETARAYRQAGEGTAAIRLLKKAATQFDTEVKTRADIYYELALAAFDEQRFREAMDSFAIALQAKDFPSAHYLYAQAAYLSDDRKVATEQIELALKFDGKNQNTLMLAARIALEGAATRDRGEDNMRNFTQALEYAKQAYSLTGTKERAQLESFARQLTAKLRSSDPLTIDHLRIADEATTALLPLNAETRLQRGRTRLLLSQFGYSSAQMNADAIIDLREAAQEAKAKGLTDSQFQVLDLELAEAYLTGGRFSNAARLAQQFLTEKRDPGSAAASYEPVAYLLKFAGEALATGSDNAKFRDVVLKKMNTYNRWPRLTIDGKRATDVPIAEWDFTGLDRFLCSQKDLDGADAVLRLSVAIQKQLGQGRTLQEAPCTLPEDRPRSSR